MRAEEPDEPDEPDEAVAVAGPGPVPTVESAGNREFEFRTEVLTDAEVATGRSALESVRGQEPDLVLLDWVLPDLSGIEVCRELRRRGADCPIVMLTGRTSKVDVVVGLEVGADDYITKPFDARELTARLAANLRRVRRASPGPSLAGLLRLGGVVIDVDGRRVL